MLRRKTKTEQIRFFLFHFLHILSISLNISYQKHCQAIFLQPHAVYLIDCPSLPAACLPPHPWRLQLILARWRCPGGRHHRCQAFSHDWTIDKGTSRPPRIGLSVQKEFAVGVETGPPALPLSSSSTASRAPILLFSTSSSP